jgi:hypothetical protein
MHRRPLHKGSPRCQGSVGRSRWYSVFRIRLFAPRRAAATLHARACFTFSNAPLPKAARSLLVAAGCVAHGGRHTLAIGEQARSDQLPESTGCAGQKDGRIGVRLSWLAK